MGTRSPAMLRSITNKGKPFLVKPNGQNKVADFLTLASLR